MLRFILLTILLTGCVDLACAQQPKALVGKYQLEVQGGDILELRADGSASLAGEETRWEARGNQLSVGGDTMNYKLVGGRLLLDMGGVQMAWKRLGAAPGEAKPTQRGKRQADREVARPLQSQGSSQDAEARRVLTSSAWCSFTYSSTSGTSTTQRVVFRQDGMLIIDSGAETYSSGYGGTYAGQSGSRGSKRWKLQNLRLYIDEGQGAGYQDVNLTAEKNSSGWPILHAAGREYSMCK